MSIFLKENSTRHSLITKQKQFSDKPKIKSTGNRLTGWLNTSENPIRIDEDKEPPAILQEEDDDVVELKDIPKAGGSKKRKSVDGKDNEDDDALFVSSSDEEYFATQRANPSKRRKQTKTPEEVPEEPVEDEGDQDDKKKLLLDTSYDGFSIYGRILCLIVTRKSKKEPAVTAPTGGSQMMEQWVSTQAAQENGLLEDDDG